jgi:hypothetical protein
MRDKLLLDWPTTQARDMEHKVLKGRHALASKPEFSDEALIRLLDTHPREDVHVLTMTGDDNSRDWRRGDPGDLSGERLLEMLRKHCLWLNVLRVTQHNESFSALVDGLYDDLEEQCPGFEATARNAHLLISNPQARVFYHADVPLNILWHVRGRKRVYVYPPHDDHFISADFRESLYRGDIVEDVPYAPEFESHVTAYDLEPGDVVTWPQTTPHRVVNTDGLNVSLTTEYLTKEARRRIAVYLANNVLRRYLPGRFEATAVEGAGALAKATTLRLLRRTGIVRFNTTREPISFRLDPNAPDGMVAIDGAGDRADREEAA